MASKSYTTEDIKKSIKIMEDEGLDLDAPTEVSIEGDSGVYEIDSIGHFHAVPNMTLSFKLKGRADKDSNNKFTLRAFLDLYNFKYMPDGREDTDTIRIYSEFPSKYIELGVNDWSYSESSKNEIIKESLNKKTLSRAVTSFNYDHDREIFCVYLEEFS